MGCCDNNKSNVQKLGLVLLIVLIVLFTLAAVPLEIIFNSLGDGVFLNQTNITVHGVSLIYNGRA